jgi:ketosteroid isomerase-like protein
VVRDAYGRFNAGDLEGFLALLDRDIRWFTLDPAIRPVSSRGRESVHRFLSGLLSSVADYRVDPDTIQCSGEKVLVRARHSGRHVTSEVVSEMTFVHLVSVRHGRITRFRLYLDEGKARAAFGGRGGGAA